MTKAVIVSRGDFGRLEAVAMVDGGFDPLHGGHIAYFEAAAGLGLPVFCCIAADEYVSGKHAPFLPQEERGRIIDSIRHISYTHLSSSSTAEVLDALRPRYYVKGSDWRGRLPAEETAICERNGTEPVFLDTVLDSSSRILRDFMERAGAEVGT